MKTRHVAAASIVALAIAVGWPGFNWAQDGKPEPIAVERPEQPERSEQPEQPEQPERFEQALSLRDQARALHEQASAMRTAAAADRAAFEAKKEVEFNFKHFDPGRFGFPARDDQIRQAAAKVRDAKDEAARTAAMTQLISQLDQYFEQDMQARIQELQAIEARLRKLGAQLDHRRDKKSEIIDLQAKVAINEADGLGFYGQPNGDRAFNFSVPVPIISTSNGELLIQSPPSAAAPVPTAAPQ